MPTFEIEAPDGTYEIDAPDEQTAIEAFRSHISAPQQEALTEQKAAPQSPRDSWIASLRQKVMDTVGAINRPQGTVEQFNERLQANQNAGSRLGQEGPPSGAENLLQAMTFNRADDLARMVGADEFAQNINDKQERFRQEHPVGSLGYDVLGAGLTTGLAGAGLARMAPKAAAAMNPVGRSLPARMARYGAIGATESGLYSSGEEGNDTGDVTRDALIGGAVGAMVPVAGQAAQRIYNKATGAVPSKVDRKAARKVMQALDADQVSPAKAAGRMQRADTMLIDAGDENLMGLGRAVSAKPGEGRNIINKALDSQQKARAGQVVRAVNDALGGADETFNRKVADIVAKRGKSAQKAYDAAFAGNFAKGHSPHFDAIQNRLPAEAVRNAMKVAQAEGRPFGQQLIASIDDASGTVTFRRAPSLREWHYIQRGLRGAADSAYRNGVGEVGSAYKSLHKELLGLMDKANPNYKLARSAYATESQMIDALQRGRDIMKPAVLNNLDQFADDFAKMSTGEKEMVRTGLARGLEDMVASTPDAAGDAVRKLFGTSQRRAAIKAVFPSDSAFRQFEVRMRRLAKEAGVFKNIRTGSRTAFVEAEKDGLASQAAEAGFDVATGGFFNATMRALKKVLLRRGMDEKTAASVAKLLTERNPNAVLMALSNRGTKLPESIERMLVPTGAGLSVAISQK